MTDGGPASHGGSAIGHMIGGGASARGTVRVTERVQIVQVQCMGYQCMCAQAVIPTLKLAVWNSQGRVLRLSLLVCLYSLAGGHLCALGALPVP